MATIRLQSVAIAGVLGSAFVALSACGGDDRAPERVSERRLPPPAEVKAAVACAPGSRRALGNERVAYAAVVEGKATAYRAPGGEPLHVFDKLNANGVPTVFGIRAAILDEDCKPKWYHVQLPLKPNGVTGFVRARDVWVGKVRTRIEIDLSERRVTLFRDGKEVLSAPAAIGTSATPTPTGTYYVNQRLIPHDKSGPFGPGAIGISAFSEVLTGWAQGGPIAIHGTNQPWTIGKSASNGCLRVRNDLLDRIFDATLAGTPVEIRS